MLDGISLFWFLVIGIAAGWIAGLIMKGSGFGMVGDLIVGVLGAIVGGFLFSFFGITAGGLMGSLIMAIVGAVVFLFIASLIRRTPHPIT